MEQGGEHVAEWKEEIKNAESLRQTNPESMNVMQSRLKKRKPCIIFFSSGILTSEHPNLGTSKIRNIPFFRANATRNRIKIDDGRKICSGGRRRNWLDIKCFEN
jgi:hypothetical protein